MFEDGRSKKVVFLAHCLLNQNSISDGTAVYPAAFKEVISFFLEHNIGIVQMPCPELNCLGLDRGNADGANSPVVQENTRIRQEMMQTEPHEKLQKLVEHVMKQILEYHKYGFEMIGIVGANRSPNCGIDTTSDYNEEIAGKGVFMEELNRRLETENIPIPMVGLKSSDDLVGKLKHLLKL